jgi:hypothetical protein
MALVEIVRFADLREAQVACSALTAMGFDPFLFDEYRAAAIWTEQSAIGGLRIVVPQDQAEEAKAFVDAVRASPPTAKAAPEPVYEAFWMAGMLAACFMVGWPLAGFRRTDRFHRGAALGITLATVFLLGFGGLVYLSGKG